MRQRSLARRTSSLSGVSVSRFESQYLVGSSAPSGHSASSTRTANSPPLAAPRSSLLAGRTRRQRKRERSFRPREPSRQATSESVSAPAASASSLSEEGLSR